MRCCGCMCARRQLRDQAPQSAHSKFNLDGSRAARVLCSDGAAEVCVCLHELLKGAARGWVGGWVGVCAAVIAVACVLGGQSGGWSERALAVRW